MVSVDSGFSLFDGCPLFNVYGKLSLLIHLNCDLLCTWYVMSRVLVLDSHDVNYQINSTEQLTEIIRAFPSGSEGLVSPPSQAVKQASKQASKQTQQSSKSDSNPQAWRIAMGVAGTLPLPGHGARA